MSSPPLAANRSIQGMTLTNMIFHNFKKALITIHRRSWLPRYRTPRSTRPRRFAMRIRSVIRSTAWSWGRRTASSSTAFMSCGLSAATAGTYCSIAFSTGRAGSRSGPIAEYLRPDDAVRLAGVETGGSDRYPHQPCAHWDHMGGIDLFPDATVWIQEDEYRYYTGDAWQPGGRNGGIDPGRRCRRWVQINTEWAVAASGGRQRGDPAGPASVYRVSPIRIQSQYLLVEGEPNYRAGIG